MTSARLLSTKLFVPPYISVVSTPRHRSFTGNAVLRHNDDHRASSKLFEDAAREEAEEAAAPPRPSKVTMLEGENENWTGEESVKDALLRMLVDKYKPLRSGPIRTADEKLKQAPPKVSPPGGGPDFVTSPPSAETSTEAVTPRRYLPNEPLLPSIEGHRPWHTTFKVPSHATSNVRYGHIPNPVRRGAPLSVDEKAKRKERDMKRRTEQAGRLSRARESTLDYRLGIKNGADAMHRRPNPASMKGWASLVEDKIERARQEGLFKNIKGRGQPLASTLQERNPFIGREEFLMNRIVQRQGAAPPWIEVQGELESAIASFRDVVRQSWTRRAIRMLTLSQPASLLPNISLADITPLRDAEWEDRERSFHDQALEEVNGLVRKHNGLAPYADILQGLADRVKATGPHNGLLSGNSEETERTVGSTASTPLPSLGFREMVRDLWQTFRGR